MRPAEDRGRQASGAAIVLSLLVLALGTLVYALDRPPEAAPLLSFISVGSHAAAIFGPIGDHLPSFAHAFAFSLLTAVCLGGARQSTRLACLTWLGIDTAFEAGQHPQIAESLVRLTPDWLESLPILGLTDSYFLSGTFDTRDLIAIAAGVAAAYFIYSRIATGGKRHA